MCDKPDPHPPRGFRPPTASEIIDRLGGTGAVADLFLIRRPSVSQWRAEGIPTARMHFLRHVHPEVLRPIEVASNPPGPGAGRAANDCA